MRRILALPLFVCLAAAQMPHLGDIDYYGLHRLTPTEIMKATGLEPGGKLPPSKADLEDKLEELPDVVEARVEAVCCEGDRAALFIGIEEKGAPHASFRSDPSGDATLPQDLLDRYQGFVAAVQRAAALGNTAEDLTAGHSMMEDPAARAYQQGFIDYAAAHMDALRKALHESPDAGTRAAAAAIIGYGPEKQVVVDELQYALDDPDPAVRQNAMRSLDAFIVYAQKHAAAGLTIQPTWLVELLHSVELNDREQAAKTLALLTDANAPEAMKQPAIDLMRERALADLAAMARWPTLSYALPPFLLMGRLAGLADSDIEAAWSKGDREPVIVKALDTVLPKSKTTRK
jgi:hypothetical protein